MSPRRSRIWQPRFAITPAMATDLMAIEHLRTVVDATVVPPEVQAQLQHKARTRSAHFSTRIEGNRLTLEQAEQVLPPAASKPAKTPFAGRERDVIEVRNYWHALRQVEDWAAAEKEFTPALIRRLHALVEAGPGTRPTPLRDGQNVIRDAASGAIIYLPPEAKDVPGLLEELAAWVRRSRDDRLPPPLVAGLVHYQLATIHPFYDGNGRTARLLATFVLQRGGYGLRGWLPLEERHARDLMAYYEALMVHPHHNYYEGRAEADLTPWLLYFLDNLAAAIQEIHDQTEPYRQGPAGAASALRRLDERARRVLALFTASERITSQDVARELALSQRMARELLRRWTEEGWLEVLDEGRRTRSYGLSAIHRQSIGNPSAIHRQ